MARARKSGLDFVGDINWGTHMCQFYKTKQDLLDVLVPYFTNGLKNNEFCVWVTSEFLNKEEATNAMQGAVPNFSEYLGNGQMEIFPYTEWYLQEGKFELQRVLDGWVGKHDNAIAAGYAGMRVTGNPFWIDNKKDWDDFAEYEAEINNVIDDYKLLVLCTYSLDKCKADEIIDVVTNHKFAMIKRSGKWTLIESSAQKKIEEALRKTERRFADLYASMAEGVALHQIIYDAEGKPVDYRILDVNPAFERHTGLCREDSVGKKASEIYGTAYPPYLDVYSEVAFTGKPILFETYFAPMEKHFSISCSSYAKGKFTTVFHDVTERKKSDQALLRAKVEWERTFDSDPDLIAILDSNHRIIRANKAMAKALRKEPQLCVGLNCYTCVHGLNSPPTFCPHSKTVNDGKEHVEEVHEDRLGGDFLVSTTPLLDENGQMVGSVHVARDITTRKQMENKLQEYASHLEELVQERTRQLQDQERMVAIGQTAGMVGHDIRNPLQAIMSDVYLLKSDLASMPACETKEGVAESLDGIEKNIGYINKIVADLQDYARPLYPDYAEVNLPDLIVSTLQAITIPDNIKFSVDVDIASSLRTDAIFVRRALTNLVNNALQAMPESGRLELASFEKESKVYISVRDTGLGIPEAVKPKLFTPMMTTKSKGQGLGLAVVKRLVEALGGAITFESQEGKGTKFTIELPRKA